ncbi:rap guanine nucleotide exchange factor 6-like isoform X2 [Oratosquilla oratoria]|uniref:rap guanine nucleotide exchange factor 6-like isoform X2 n=1 Tax=Oratosquilla oratoria TaxID=337810 RepID=UPI003F773E35
MGDYHDKRFILALKVPPEKRTTQELDLLYGSLRSMEALCWLREPALRSLCNTVRYESHASNDILYCRGELATCWYILLSGSVFIDGSMFLPRSSFGKRSGGGGRRANECLILEPSEMIVIDYPDGQLMRPGQRSSVNTMNLEKLLALEQEEITIRPKGGGSAPAVPHQGAHMAGSSGINHQDHISTSHHSSPSQHHHPHHNSLHYHQDPQYLPDLVSGGMVRGGRSRGSVGSSVRDGSDTSSAYSGSDTMCHSLQSSIEPDDVDLSGLMESIVDSDEEDLAESIGSLLVRDAVRECLEKNPTERKEDDIEVLLEFTQRLKAFSNLTLEVRRAMCNAMVFAVVVEAQTILMNDGEELDSWSVIINGSVEVTQPDGTAYELHLGDSFGITPTMEKMYHQGVMRSKVDDCQFVCIRQSDYYRILHQGEENTHRLEEDGVVVLLTEQRNLDGGSRKGNIVIKGTPEILMSQLVEVENNVDPTYVEDFLLTHRTFIENPLVVANKLLHWFEDPSLRDRVTRVVVLWVNNHFSDFERAPMMMNFLEQFEDGLEREKMVGQLRLLDIACANKARARTVTLTIPSKDDFLHFSILGGYEKGYGIFISKVEKGSKAEEVGLKRGDQILEVNGQKFCTMSHTRALELLRSTCHLSITVKSNLLEFKEMLQTPDGSPRPRNRKCSEIQGSNAGIADIRMTGRLPAQLPPDFASTINLVNDMASQHSPREKKEGKGTLMTNKLIKAMKNLMPKNSNNESQINSEENISPESSVGGQLYRSYSNPDISTSTGGYEDVRAEYPEHVLKVYRATDQSARFLLVHKETTAREVVMLSLQIFNINDPTGSNNYALYEVTVTEEGIVKQKRLPDLLENLAERIGLNSRYYLKSVTNSQTLVPDEIVSELIRESQVHFLQLKSVELAIQLTLEDFAIFRQIEPTEYIDYLFNLKSNYGTPALSQFEELVNREMFWVATEICSEHTLVKRSKIIKQFIKVARQCKECKNFNSMFAILSGLGHGAVSRLRQTWERLPSKYLKMFQDMQDLMDPSRNMSKYRNLINNEHVQPPIIPFYPVVARDLTFTHEGNDDKVDGLVNFEKLRMIARYIRELKNMCSAPYDLFTMLELGGQPHSTAMIAMNQMTTGGHQVATVKRRKKSTAAPDKKKMFEEAQMVRRVKAYLSNLRIITDEEQLRNMSVECEPGAESSRSGASGSISAPSTNPQTRKRHHSPTPSTTSSTSSTSHTSDSKKTTAKFGAASPASMRKIMSLAESKTKPYHGPRPSNPSHHSLSPSPSPGPPRRGGSSDSSSFNPPKSSHERSHSDTPAVPVNLSPESSSVTSLSNLRKSLTSGQSCGSEPELVGPEWERKLVWCSKHSAGHMINHPGVHQKLRSVNSSEGPSFQGETDSGISTSSLEGGVGGSTFDGGHYPPSPPSHHRRFSHQPGVPNRHDRMRRPPDYTATQMRMNHGMRTLSHDGYYTHHQEDDDEEAQVSAV